MIGAGDAAAELDALRRRLYREGASEEDLERYRALLVAQPQPDPQPAFEPAGAGPTAGSGRPGGSRRIRPAALLLVGALAAGAAALALTTAPPVRRPTPTPTARATPPPAVALQVPASARAAFVRDLDRGRGAGLADWFVHHPESRPAQVTTLQRAATEEHHGAGAADVLLEPSALADRGGRMTVILTLARDGDAGWHAVRAAERANHMPYAQEVARRGLSLTAGLPLSTTIAYEGEAPGRLRVRAPAGARWDVLVVFSD